MGWTVNKEIKEILKIWTTNVYIILKHQFFKGLLVGMN